VGSGERRDREKARARARARARWYTRETGSSGKSKGARERETQDSLAGLDPRSPPPYFAEKNVDGRASTSGGREGEEGRLDAKTRLVFHVSASRSRSRSRSRSSRARIGCSNATQDALPAARSSRDISLVARRGRCPDSPAEEGAGSKRSPPLASPSSAPTPLITAFSIA
jgi:hypothetical protein